MISKPHGKLKRFILWLKNIFHKKKKDQENGIMLEKKGRVKEIYDDEDHHDPEDEMHKGYGEFIKKRDENIQVFDDPGPQDLDKLPTEVEKPTSSLEKTIDGIAQPATQESVVFNQYNKKLLEEQGQLKERLEIKEDEYEQLEYDTLKLARLCQIMNNLIDKVPKPDLHIWFDENNDFLAEVKPIWEKWLAEYEERGEV